MKGENTLTLVNVSVMLKEGLNGCIALLVDGAFKNRIKTVTA